MLAPYETPGSVSEDTLGLISGQSSWVHFVSKYLSNIYEGAGLCAWHQEVCGGLRRKISFDPCPLTAEGGEGVHISWGREQILGSMTPFLLLWCGCHLEWINQASTMGGMIWGEPLQWGIWMRVGQDNGMDGWIHLGVGTDDGIHMCLQHETKSHLICI